MPVRKLSHEEILETKPSVSEVLKKKKNNIYALLDNVRSLYNVGAIFRTSDAVQLKKLFLCGITGTPPRPEIEKTALGATQVVGFEYEKNPITVIQKLKKKGVKIVAIELCKESKDFRKMKIEGETCFVFGHEVFGVSDEILKYCDEAYHIPMGGRANSLNVATCFGVIMFEVLKKLKK